MKKAEFINNVWPNLTIVNGDKAATQIPYGIGDIHRFSWRYDLLQQRSEIIDGRRCTWIDVLTDDGYGISYNQLCRKDNGLNLDGQTPHERLYSFLDILKSSEHITLTQLSHP